MKIEIKITHNNNYSNIYRHNVIIQKDKKKAGLVRCLHGECFSPVQYKVLKAINNKNLITWLGLDSNIVLLPTHVTATMKGHRKHEKQHLQSTKKQ